eukprot:s1261_g26.t1
MKQNQGDSYCNGLIQPVTHPGDTEDPLPQRHFLADPRQPRLSYIGFIRPNVGAIPPMAEMQAMWWCRLLENQVKDSWALARP